MDTLIDDMILLFIYTDAGCYLMIVINVCKAIDNCHTRQ